VLFHEGREVGRQQRLLLGLYGLLLSRVQGRAPAFGVVWHGRECKPTRVRLDADLRRAERLLREVKETAGSAAPPRLLLNDHCQVCEFRRRCQEQAGREDNLSLLKFKDLMARHYQPTYDGLLRRIVSGHLLHADETKIELKGGEEGAGSNRSCEKCPL
jgi:predicted RecB family nuclease